MLHYLLPFVIIVFVLLHILLLHETGRTRRRGGRDREFKVKFFPFLVIKDGINLSFYGLFIVFCCLAPFALGDCENFKEANLMRRPIHIQPE